MVLILEEISNEEFQSLAFSSMSYFSNGVVFDHESNDITAFEKVDFENDNSISYWKVIEKK